MNWDGIIWLSGIIFGLVTIMTIMNIAWGNEEERENAKSLVVQFLCGLALAAIAVLVINFVAKPVLAWIITFLSKLF